MNEFNIDKVDFNLLKSLRVLIEEKHVGKAAKRMHVSQSAMSHTLARLRDTFSDPLFVRTAKGLEPTGRALGLAEDLSTVLDDIGRLLAPESFDPSKVNTRIRLQTHSFIIASYLSPFFNKMHKQAPNLTFETHGISEYSYQQLDKGAVDMIIGAGLQAPLRFLQRRIEEEDRVCLIDKNHPSKDNWGLKHFLNYSHIKNTLLEDKDDPIDRALRKQNQPARKIGFYADDMLAQGVIIKDSNLIATIPRSLAKISSKQYDHLIMPCPIKTDNVVIKVIWHQRSQNDLLHKWLREQLAGCSDNDLE